MATFTSVQSGLWNLGTTWGATGSTKGIDWPGNTGDVVNIGPSAGQAHRVTYNVSETNELGQITVGAVSGASYSELYFSRSTSSLLTMGHADILIRQTGILDMGTSADMIPSSYTAKITILR